MLRPTFVSTETNVHRNCIQSHIILDQRRQIYFFFKNRVKSTFLFRQGSMSKIIVASLYVERKKSILLRSVD